MLPQDQHPEGLRFSLDDNNNSIANLLRLFGGNAASQAVRPQRIVVYTLP